MRHGVKPMAATPLLAAVNADPSLLAAFLRARVSFSWRLDESCSRWAAGAAHQRLRLRVDVVTQDKSVWTDVRDKFADSMQAVSCWKRASIVGPSP